VKTFTQIHCLLDCMASILREDGRVDFRPLYIGVWNADFESTDKGISYYTNEMDIYNWPYRIANLYDSSICDWYDYSEGKLYNLNTLVNRISEAKPNEFSVIMVDLFYLPYSQQYRTKHMAHLIVVERRAGEDWFIHDPYLSWRGAIPNFRMVSAFGFMEIGKGFSMNTSSLRPPKTEIIKEYFEQDISTSPGRLVAEVENYVHKTVKENNGYAPKYLFDDIMQAGIIAKRYAGYSIVLDYFAEDADFDRGPCSTAVTHLIVGFEKLILMIARLGILNREVDLTLFSEKINNLLEIEIDIKRQLNEAYALWKSRTLEPRV